MRTFTVIAHFTHNLYDPVRFDILSPDGTERVIESREVDWADYADRPLDLAIGKLIYDRWLDYQRPVRTREMYVTNHDNGQNFVLYEVDYEV